MKHVLKAMAFDVDPAARASLQAGLPGWEIEVVEGATAAMLMEGWSPGLIDLFIVQAGGNDKQTLALCAFLAGASAFLPVGAGRADSWEPRQSRWQTGSPDEAPLFVLVPAKKAVLVRAVLRAGAASCLVLPIDAREVANKLARSHRSNQPGRHTLDLDQAQIDDRWRDDGGQG